MINKILDFIAALSILGFLSFVLNSEVIFDSNLSKNVKYELIIFIIIALVNTIRLIMIVSKNNSDNEKQYLLLGKRKD